ncbi:TPA: hypothetical protein ACTADN_001898 [Salmonella enterica subsp. enterica serovar Birkenhead]
MNKQEKQFKGIPPSVIFTPFNYRAYVNMAENLYLSNLQDFDFLMGIGEPYFHEMVQLHDYFISFHLLCVDLLNQDFQHGYYRPDVLDVRRLLCWMKGVSEMSKKLSFRLRTLSDEVHS